MSATHPFDVSIVIVSVADDGHLRRCLDSLRTHTRARAETFVVANRFSAERTAALRRDYPWVRVFESEGIRGFAENNNLALRHCTGEFCLVLNDDTFMDRPVVDRLLEILRNADGRTAVASPTLRYPGGKLQRCGRPRLNFWKWYLSSAGFWSENGSRSPHVNGTGVFRTYNLCGAAFLIRTDVFRTMGFFDERYFFCPEDVALSTRLNRAGYACVVDADLPLYHIEGGTGSPLQAAIIPASRKGAVLFYADGSPLRQAAYARMVYLLAFAKWIYWRTWGRHLPRAEVMARAHRHTCETICSPLTPKETFVKYYRPEPPPT